MSLSGSLPSPGRHIETDLLILGNGPSAVASALAANDCGLSVTLVAKPMRGRNDAHPTLQSFHARVADVLRFLRVESALYESSAARFRAVSINSEEIALSPYSGEEGFHVVRNIFDKKLLEVAIARGIRMVDSNAIYPVILEGRLAGLRLENDTEIRALFTFDGSGRARSLASRMSVSQQLCSTRLIVQTGVIRRRETKWSSDRTTFRPSPRGWFWTTPELDGTMTWTALYTPDDRKRDELLELRSLSERGSVRSADASWRLSRRMALPGLLLIGDAAGYLDPAWGQGVLMAIRSGLRAVEAVTKMMTEPSLQGWHEADYHQWFVNEFNIASRLLAHAYRMQSIEVGFRAIDDR